MARPSVTVANERRKAAAGLLYNSGGALLAATAVKLYGDPTFDLAVLIWSVGGGMLIFGGWLTLSLLEEEF